MPRIVADNDRCEGHGLCEQAAPTVFRLDDAGELHIDVAEVTPDQEPTVAAAVRVCPMAALRLQP